MNSAPPVAYIREKVISWGKKMTMSKSMLTDGVHPLMVPQMGQYSPTSTLGLRPEVFHPIKQLDRVVAAGPGRRLCNCVPVPRLRTDQ